MESAVNELTQTRNGKSYSEHSERRKRAEQILKLSTKTMRSLWTARNIDFYGNIQPLGEAKELSRQEIEENLRLAKEIITRIEKVLKTQGKI